MLFVCLFADCWLLGVVCCLVFEFVVWNMLVDACCRLAAVRCRLFDV